LKHVGKKLIKKLTKTVTDVKSKYKVFLARAFASNQHAVRFCLLKKRSWWKNVYIRKLFS